MLDLIEFNEPHPIPNDSPQYYTFIEADSATEDTLTFLSFDGVDTLIVSLKNSTLFPPAPPPLKQELGLILKFATPEEVKLTFKLGQWWPNDYTCWVKPTEEHEVELAPGVEVTVPVKREKDEFYIDIKVRSAQESLSIGIKRPWDPRIKVIRP